VVLSGSLQAGNWSSGGGHAKVGDSEPLHTPFVRFTLQTSIQRLSAECQNSFAMMIHQRTDSRWAVSIFVGIMVACLLGFVASHTKGALWLFNAAQAEFAAAVTLGSEGTLVAAKKSDMKPKLPIEAPPVGN
jgi:hypothetical protein